jgi:hypothetical protein
MSETSAARQKAYGTAFVILAFRPIVKNSLIGFATVEQPSGIRIADTSIYQRDGTAWASPPSKPMLDRDGRQMRDPDGKLRWTPLITFADRRTQTIWSDAVIAALKAAYPDVLA